MNAAGGVCCGDNNMGYGHITGVGCQREQASGVSALGNSRMIGMEDGWYILSSHHGNWCSIIGMTMGIASAYSSHCIGITIVIECVCLLHLC